VCKEYPDVPEKLAQNRAAATVEAIAPAWPGVLERVENLASTTRRFTVVGQEAERRSLATAARQAELERQVSATFSITLAPKIGEEG
jgi:hypothetical protein